MPHDKNGVELHEGDVVTLICTVKTVAATDSYCNCQLETVETMQPDGGKTQIVVNTRQTVKDTSLDCKVPEAVSG